MSTTPDADYQFLLCCLKHSGGKPDFDAVAKELGLNYQRHWGIMKKAGVAGTSGKGRKPGSASTNGAAGGGQKRAAPAKKVKKSEDDKPEPEPEPETEDESDEDVESPAKKAKADPDED